MSAYYNENDPKTAAWLRELIKSGHIAPGEVDERSITDVQPDDLRGFIQCHFFAGIGGWSYALRLAGWPDDKPVWTGSCPCQPFSVGATDAAEGTGDERDLWPVFFTIIEQCSPARVFGEQVRNAITWGWWDRAAMDLEGIQYTVAAAVMRSDATGAKHERKRLYWVADAGRSGREGREQVQCVSEPAPASLTIYGDPIARAGRALAGDWDDLFTCDGLSVQLVRDAIKGFGNAIQPQVAAEFIQATREAIADMNQP